MGNEAPRIFVALVHFPVYNKARQLVASSLTTLNLHDLARITVTYGTCGLYIVTPLRRQQELAHDVIAHWTEGYGSVYNPTRAKALQHLCVVDTLDDVERDIIRRCGITPQYIATDARPFPGRVSYSVLREKLWQPGAAFLLLLGTAWGLSDELICHCNYILTPIYGPTTYNHLPVRVAAGVILDRLLGDRPDTRRSVEPPTIY